MRKHERADNTNFNEWGGERSIVFESNSDSNVMSENPASQESAQMSNHDPVALVASILEGYAGRGVFAGFRQDMRQGRKADFSVQWHFRRILSIRLDASKSSLTIPGLFPQVSAAPNIRRELSAFLRRYASPEQLPHRRIDPEKSRMTCYVRNDALSLRFAVQDNDYEYATRKMVHLVNEIFLDFLREAQYVDYMVAHMGMNPETGGSL